MKKIMNSKLYVGQVSHRRHTPTKHSFSYSMFMMYLDLDELPWLFDKFIFWSSRHFNLAYFKRGDHLGDKNTDLKESVYNLAYEKAGIHLDGPVRLLTHLTYFAYGFNPVSFYYCFNKDDTELRCIVAEVNNTPWGEQHCYVLDTANTSDQDYYRFELSKEFHVSPFNPMDQDYKWVFRHNQQMLSVYMENWRHDEKVFDAGLSFKPLPITSLNLAKMLFRFPFITMKVTFSIYYQALKLLLKKTPLYTHPDKLINDNSDSDEVKS